MLETLLIRSRATPSEPPRRRGATSLGPERDRFGVLKGVLAAVPWLQVGMGAVIVLLAALVPWGTGKVLGAMDQQILAVDVKGDFVGDSRVAIERAAGDWSGREANTASRKSRKAWSAGPGLSPLPCAGSGRIGW